jgi:hypothetical protein
MSALTEEEFVEELYLTACNEGATYKKPKEAVALAFKQFQQRRREDELESFELWNKQIEDRLRKRWRNQ